jgi:hypothetical protein
MGAVYSEILSATEAQGFAPPRRRVSLPKSRLVAGAAARIVFMTGLLG